ncbi:MAG: hypothetical protein FWF59_02245 [Turicibacter sp.]|nr:hypothetical protein [Turicibacter sp.]
MNIRSYEELGKLEIIHIFDYYDIPLYFISKSPEDEFYLNYMIEELEDGRDKWFFSKVSMKEIKGIMTQKMGNMDLLKYLYHSQRLHYLFLNDETPKKDELLKLELVGEENYDYEAFPVVNSFAEYDYANGALLTPAQEEEIAGEEIKCKK